MSRWLDKVHAILTMTIVAMATLLSAQAMSMGETQRTYEDRFAERDIRDAAQDIDLMNRILGAELQRLNSGVDGSESAEVRTYLNESSGKSMDLGDLRVPLSTRYIERARRQFVAAIALAKATTPTAFLTYLDEHAAHARYVNNRLLFDDPAEAEAMRVLLERLGTSTQ